MLRKVNFEVCGKFRGLFYVCVNFFLPNNVNGKIIHELEKICNEVAVVCPKHGAQLLFEGPREITKKRHKACVRAGIRNEHNPNASLGRGEVVTVYILHYFHPGYLSRLH
jgi:hypothetical protein